MADSVVLLQSNYSDENVKTSMTGMVNKSSTRSMMLSCEKAVEQFVAQEQLEKAKYSQLMCKGDFLCYTNHDCTTIRFVNHAF